MHKQLATPPFKTPRSGRGLFLSCQWDGPWVGLTISEEGEVLNQTNIPGLFKVSRCKTVLLETPHPWHATTYNDEANL